MTKWTTPAAALLTTGILALGLTACGGDDGSGSKAKDKGKSSAGKKDVANKAGAGSGSSGGAAGSGQPKSIRKGDSGTKVKCVQRAVNTFNKPQIVADGSFGSKTVSAVKLFQGNNGQSKDGVVGPKTGRRMEMLMEDRKKANLDNPQAVKRYATWLNDCKSLIPN
ncbi:peptidoglycan-binding protein [Streptomyces sp. YC504]|uniref:Peptidoglycan-binding protein n=1 Tax=Streptomyces mesophilus TaxID=1775132 RepID=A0A6G4XI80_9ACTN|nr:peptidoglycan-binding domain-containing protein [Streptomyces mesophilus]NGO76892.1 peptidoglycan-binding protein [Streptomyces mesophilus]